MFQMPKVQTGLIQLALKAVLKETLESSPNTSFLSFLLKCDLSRRGCSAQYHPSWLEYLFFPNWHDSSTSSCWESPGFWYLICVSRPVWEPCIVLGIFFIQSFVILFLYIEIIIIIIIFSPHFFFNILVQTILWSGNRLYLWVECVMLCDIFIFNNFENLPGTILLLALYNPCHRGSGIYSELHT